MKRIENILIIDDDPIHNYICKKAIHKMDCCKAVHFESNGLLGINYLKNLIEKEKPLPEIILLDVYMPVLDGFGFIERFNKLNANKEYSPYIAFISASEKSKEHKRFDQKTKFISKPIDTLKLEDLFLCISSDQSVPHGMS
ncbi:MAG TPA: response regulator [Cytophagaceae bacterium]|jgi:CheY-like chemotaxis protein